jgi:hypothetical protein
MIVGIDLKSESLLIRARASMPLISGMFKSIKMRSGRGVYSSEKGNSLDAVPSVVQSQRTTMVEGSTNYRTRLKPSSRRFAEFMERVTAQLLKAQRKVDNRGADLLRSLLRCPVPATRQEYRSLKLGNKTGHRGD